VEPSDPGQRRPEESVERIVLVAAVPGGLLLDVSAHVIDRGVGELDAVDQPATCGAS
jgi:hypothetical protein